MCAQSSGSTSSDDVARLASAVREATLGVVWRQWRALGVSAAATNDRDGPLRSPVDPEALLLASLLLVEEERRLGDILHGWAALDSALLSVQRTKNLANAYPDGMRGDLSARLAWFAEAARTAGKDHRWRKAHQEWSQSALDAGAAPERPVVRGEGKSRDGRMRASEPAALMLRLRLAFGVSVKADALSYLIAHPESSATISDIAGSLGYTVAAVRRAVDDLVEARMIHADVARSMTVRAEYDVWAKLLELPQTPLAWGHWAARFRFAGHLEAWARSVESRELSEYAYAVSVRDVAEQHAGAFATANWAICGRSGRNVRGAPPDHAKSIRMFLETMLETA